MKVINNIPVWGEPIQNAIDQMANCLKTAHSAALMADHHLGYAVPVGGVIAYENAISPSGVGFDIACGNKAVLTDAKLSDVKNDISKIMDEIVKRISFGVGMTSKTRVSHELFDDEAWEIPAIADLKRSAREQLGTVGSGNHYIDIFYDEQERIWVGCHFGSRGLGHKIASHYIKAGGGVDGINVDPVVLSLDTELGKEYVAAMKLAGRYAYAGRDWVSYQVAKILGATILQEVHNHHNYAWEEEHNGTTLWVVRKGATPAFPDQFGFVGGTMGENSVILKGIDSDESKVAMYSTVHGAGRIMSRTEAAGKTKWKNGVRTKISEGKVSEEMMTEWVKGRANIELRGGGVDESPHCYKRLSEVLNSHANTIEIMHTLTPIGVAMAGVDVFDPYKD